MRRYSPALNDRPECLPQQRPPRGTTGLRPAARGRVSSAGPLPGPATRSRSPALRARQEQHVSRPAMPDSAAAPKATRSRPQITLSGRPANRPHPTSGPPISAALRATSDSCSTRREGSLQPGAGQGQGGLPARRGPGLSAWPQLAGGRSRTCWSWWWRRWRGAAARGRIGPGRCGVAARDGAAGWAGCRQAGVPGGAGETLAVGKDDGQCGHGVRARQVNGMSGVLGGRVREPRG
jgi:hypothetical protein